MSRGKVLVKQIVHLVVVDLKIAALDDEDLLPRPLALLDILVELLETVDEDAFVRESAAC